MADVPQQVSNSEFFETTGGIYPGGSGRITDIKYSLWDYDGKVVKDSVFAVHMVMQPSDGSNEGKAVEVYWSAGKSSEFQPNHDGSFPLALQVSTAPQLRTNTNWNFVYGKFRDNCGLQGAHINGPQGIRALIGSDITLSRVDQPERAGMADNEPPPTGAGAPAKKKFKPTILIPARCKYPWEGATGNAATAPRATATVTGAPPPAMTNGHNPAVNLSDIDGTIMACLSEALATETVIPMSNLPIKLMERLNTKGVTAQQRLAYLPKVKDTDYVQNLALVNGWQFDGANLSL